MVALQRARARIYQRNSRETAFMRFKIFFVFAFTFCILFSSAISYGAEDATQELPVVFLPESSYEFEPTLSGSKILHDFVIQNRGTVPLEIKRVKSH